MIHIDFSVTDNCINLEESYGEICVKCNACGRFNEDIKEEKKDESIQQGKVY